MIGTHIKYKTIFFAILFFCYSYLGFSQSKEKDLYYSFIFTEFNVLQYRSKKAFEHFASKWYSIQPNTLISIAHFGDSHVQPDLFSGTVRQRLQSIKGNGGRGMIFPYSIANTYSQIDYTSNYQGVWESANSIQNPPKLPLGISGFMARTFDSTANFTITFKTPLAKTDNIIKLYCKKTSESFDVIIKSGEHEIILPIDTHYRIEPYYEVLFPELSNEITVQVIKRNQHERYFEFYGLSIENSQQRGVIYHNLGVGGARFDALLNQLYFAQQFPFLNADLVILDWGSNDIIYKNEIPSDMELVITETINCIKMYAPDASILLTSVQDMNRRNRNISSARQFSDLVKKIAFENGCLYWDWYWVAGGPYSMAKWYAENLAQKDNIHLNMNGYQLKGNLLTQALLQGLKMYNMETITDSIIIPDEVYFKYLKLTDSTATYKPKQQPEPKKHQTYHGKTFEYTVRQGDTLGGIAARYGTTVKAIMKANNMESTRIVAGKKILIPK